MHKRFILLLVLLVSTFFIYAQEKYTVSGYVREAATGEDMFSVNVYIEELLKGTTTNEYGFYSISLPEGNYTLVFSFIGMETIKKSIELNKNIKMDVELNDFAISTEEIVVSGKRKDHNVESVEVGTVELEAEIVKEIPALLGEADILRTLQLMPGVASAGEGNSGLYVRGGGPNQNLVLLDNATVYNPGHLLGFFSVFNSDAIKNTTLIKGGIPAEYGGRISSVLDMTMREGNMKKFGVEGGLGFISSRLTVQGPFKKDRAAFLVSGRLTYLSFLLNPILKNQDVPANIPWFFDINAKMNFKIGKKNKDRIFASGYFGRDKFSFDSGGGNGFSFELPYGNATATLRWNHQFNEKLFMNNMFVFNDYDSKVTAGFQDTKFNLNSGITDYSLKGQIEYFPSITNKFKAGYEYAYHIFTPYIYEFSLESDTFTSSIDKRRAHEFALFAQDEVDVTDWLKVNTGVRFSMFSNVGPYDRIYYNETGSPIDTVSKKAFQSYATYFGIEPRLNARFKINDATSIKTGFNFNKQYMHLVSNSTTTLPYDLWVPSTDVVKPQMGVQGSIGLFRNFKDNMFETSIELYYKRLWNQVEYGNDAEDTANEEVEDLFVFGDGHAYGAEFFVKKKYGKFNGWVGYTLAWSNRKFPDIDNGKVFPAKFDRRHDLSVVLIYDVHKKWKLSSTYIYGTGQTMTPIVLRYYSGGDLRNVYGERNSYRLPAYHRLDLGVTYTMKDNDKRYSDLTFSVYNTYNRKNPYFIYDDIVQEEASANPDGTITIQAKQVSLFTILPTITWNFKY